jgi:defect-in-organelle-trafficking protein DotD
MCHKLSIALLLSCMVLLPACESRFREGAPQLVAEPDNVAAMLADAADRAANSLEKLAAVDYARSPGVAVGPVSGAPAELRRAISLQWTGPVEQVAQALADRSSYNFLIVGASPPVPIVVEIDAENKPVVEVLRDIGLQMGKRADIRVDAERKVVEIHYAPVAGTEG